MNQNSCSGLLLAIDKVSFVLDDLRLFLDTHPDNTKALSDYNELARRRQKLVDEYTTEYGPLKFYDVNNCDSVWKWNDAPLPWQ